MVENIQKTLAEANEETDDILYAVMVIDPNTSAAEFTKIFPTLDKARSYGKKDLDIRCLTWFITGLRVVGTHFP